MKPRLARALRHPRVFVPVAALVVALLAAAVLALGTGPASPSAAGAGGTPRPHVSAGLPRPAA